MRRTHGRAHPLHLPLGGRRDTVDRMTDRQIAAKVRRYFAQPKTWGDEADGLWAAPYEMNDQGDDRHEQENVNEPPRDVEHKSTQDPCDEQDHE
jgi:hypothetical protein